MDQNQGDKASFSLFSGHCAYLTFAFFGSTQSSKLAEQMALLEHRLLSAITIKV